jgi:cytochrome c oxidase cbb3-type subunit 2
VKKLWLIAGGSAAIYVVLSLFMGVFPAIELAQVPPGPGVKPYTQLEMRGREIYVSEGCAYCHTQQVRPLPVDSIFGRPSAPGDFAFQTPALLESERNGPDLTNIGVRQPSEIWQYIHLYQPRAVVPQSIMPSFSWLFQVVDTAPEGATSVPVPKPFAPAQGVVIPTDQAKALIAYLLALKQVPLTGTQAAESPEPPAPSTVTGPSKSAPVFDAAAGTRLFAANCASCHGSEGAGVPGVFPSLAGDAVVNDNDPTMHIHTVLHGLHGKTINGTAYTVQMPAFAATLSDVEIAGIISHERSSWGNHGKLVTPPDVAKVRSQK